MRTWFYNLLLILLALASITPFLWLVNQAFTAPLQANLHGWSLYNFRFLADRFPFATWMINSLFVSCAQTVLVLLLCTMGGFVFGESPKLAGGVAVSHRRSFASLQSRLTFRSSGPEYRPLISNVRRQILM